MAEATQGRAIFISYRRADAEGEAGRLFDDLVRAYGEQSVFMDVSGIQPGVDFRKAIDDNAGRCAVLLAVIGPSWATVTSSDGTRRLDNANDFVRIEIGSALARGIPVIPVLVHEAKMPALEQLPADLKDLRYRNSVELTHARWNSDVALLVSALQNYVAPASKSDATASVHATVPVQLPAPQSAVPDRKPPKSSIPLYVGIGVVVVLAIAAFLYFRGGGTPNPVPTPPIGESALLGKWKNSVEPPGADDLREVSVVDFGGQLMVEAWGKCAEKPCAWGSRKASLNGSEATTGSWELRNTPQENQLQRSASLSLSPNGSGLQVVVKNAYREANGQVRTLYNQLQFVKEP